MAEKGTPFGAIDLHGRELLLLPQAVYRSRRRGARVRSAVLPSTLTSATTLRARGNCKAIAEPTRFLGLGIAYQYCGYY